jgi:high-affinity Fe2+/Pb2+ permease
MGQQSKLKSFLESIIQTFIGTIVGFSMAFIVFPLCGVEANIQQIAGVNFIFMLIAIVKNYGIRRFFNYLQTTQKKHQSMFESVLQTGIGTIVSFSASFVIYPMFDISVTLIDITEITILFTLFSILKNYLVRRYHESFKIKVKK